MAPPSPGEAAEQAFETGVRAAAVGALTVIGVLYWVDAISLLFTAVALVLLFPTYMLVVAALLSKWLGLDKGVSDLRPVSPAEAGGSGNPANHEGADGRPLEYGPSELPGIGERGECPHCGEQLDRLDKTETAAGRGLVSRTVWECPECNATLG